MYLVLKWLPPGWTQGNLLIISSSSSHVAPLSYISHAAWQQLPFFSCELDAARHDSGSSSSMTRGRSASLHLCIVMNHLFQRRYVKDGMYAGILPVALADMPKDAPSLSPHVGRRTVVRVWRSVSAAKKSYRYGWRRRNTISPTSTHLSVLFRSAKTFTWFWAFCNCFLNSLRT